MVVNTARVVVSARDVSIEYPSRHGGHRHLAVRGVSFQLDAGEILAIIGESGAGKSTLAKAISGLTGGWHRGDDLPQICGGQLDVLQTSLRGISRRSRDLLTLKVGFLAQDAAERLSPLLTVAENVAEPIFLRDRRFNTREAADAVATKIDSVRLPLSLLNLLPHQLSSGQRQRVALARALILDPELLVADEPTRGVDAAVRDGVLEALVSVQGETQFAAIIVSSDLSVVAGFDSTVAVMQAGNIIGYGQLDTLLGEADLPYLAGLSAIRTSEPS